MSIKCRIKDSESSWVETFDVNTVEEVQKIISRFNNTLRSGETPRELVEVLETKPLRDYTDNELLQKYLELKAIAVAKAKREVGGAVADESARYLIKSISYNRLRNLIKILNDYVNLIWYHPFRELITEMDRRGWKSLHKRISNYYAEQATKTLSKNQTK